MPREITYEELRRKLENLPNIKREAVIQTIDRNNKRYMARRRSTILGGGD